MIFIKQENNPEKIDTAFRWSILDAKCLDTKL